MCLYYVKGRETFGDHTFGNDDRNRDWLVKCLFVVADVFFKAFDNNLVMVT